MNEFVRGHRARAAAWKQQTATLPDEARAAAPYVKDGAEKTAPLPFCLPARHAQLNLLPEVREGALSLFADLDIPWHARTEAGPSNHLLDSQVQCVNALGRMVTEPQRIVAAFGEALRIEEPLEIEPGRFLTFEFIGPEDFFDEGNGRPRRRGTRCTSVDAAILFTTTQGTRELALIEWKFTEYYGGQRDDSKLATRKQRYAAHVEDTAGPIDASSVTFGDLLVEPVYQLVRQQLLAHQLESTHALGADVVRVVHVLDPANAAYQASVPRGLSDLGDTVDAVWGRLLTKPDRFVHIDPAVFLDTAVTSVEYVSRYGRDQALVVKS